MEEAVLITGAARRVGRAMAVFLAGKGYDIALHYHRSQQEAQAAQAEIAALGVRCVLLQADLADIGRLPALMENALCQLPRCRTLINNASVFGRAPFMESSLELAEAQFRVNFFASAFLTQAFAAKVTRGGIINLLDTAVASNAYSHFFYLLSKKALADFTCMAAIELGPRFRVNGICPGIMLPSDNWGEEYMEKKSQRLPLRRLGTPDAVADAAFWLMRNEAVTGQILFIDGGEHLL